MGDKNNYEVSFFPKFTDPDMEKEFIRSEMKNSARVIGPVALVFGLLFISFIISDLFMIADTYSLMVTLFIRILFFAVSIFIFLAARKARNLSKIFFMINIYEAYAALSFMIILSRYETLTVMSVFSLIVLTSAFYIVPGRLINTQTMVISFNILFFVLFSDRIADMSPEYLMELIAYDFIFIILDNLQILITSYYKRKQFYDNKKLLKLYFTDPVTNIYNRNKFNEELEKWIKYCHRYRDPLSLVIFDIDDFKMINDSYGHLLGDNVLQHITITIETAIRDTDVFARWGGDEFLILLPNTDIFHSERTVERLKSIVESNDYGEVKQVTCSFGLVTLRKGENARGFIKRADDLLYMAKREGKNLIKSDL